jgi:hypothetical protein
MPIDPESEDERIALPGYRNYLIYFDESGIHGAVYYGFGSLWIPWERRGDLHELIRGLRGRHGYGDEIKWNNVGRNSVRFYIDLTDSFFRRSWLMFHALIVRKGYSNREFHRDFDEELRKRFVMLIQAKIRFFCGGARTKCYHVRVDRLPSRYRKADEAAEKIITSTLKREINLVPLKSLITRDSRATPGIQLADFLLGASLADWQNDSTAVHKLTVRRHLASHLGWPDLRADTYLSEWKFNLWSFYDPTSGGRREVQTRPIRSRFPIKPFRPN